MIVGISGKMQSGKDTVGEIWQYLHFCKMNGQMAFSSWKLLGDQERNYRWQIKKFAGKVKEIASLLTGIPVEDWEKEEVKGSYLGPEWDMNGRTMLQKIGTDCMRKHLHPDTWVNALFADYISIGGTMDVRRTRVEYPNWIITDVRFPNEAKAIKDRKGILIRVNRPDFLENAKTGQRFLIKVHRNEHPSETALDTYQDWDYVIENDGTIEELIEKVKKIYNEHIHSNRPDA